MSSFVPIATPLWPITAENLDALMPNCDFFTVTTRNCDFFIVVTRNYVAFFRNYGSQCDRSYGVTAPQFHRNETYGQSIPELCSKWFREFRNCVLIYTQFTTINYDLILYFREISMKNLSISLLSWDLYNEEFPRCGTNSEEKTQSIS